MWKRRNTQTTVPPCKLQTHTIAAHHRTRRKCTTIHQQSPTDNRHQQRKYPSLHQRPPPFLQNGLSARMRRRLLLLLFRKQRAPLILYRRPLAIQSIHLSKDRPRAHHELSRTPFCRQMPQRIMSLPSQRHTIEQRIVTRGSRNIQTAL